MFPQSVTRGALLVIDTGYVYSYGIRSQGQSFTAGRTIRHLSPYLLSAPCSGLTTPLSSNV